MPFKNLTFTTAGTALNSGQIAATAGYSVIIVLNGVVAELKSPLCPKCDNNHYTNNRAELRAAETVAIFLHELAKSTPHNDCLLIPARHRGRRGEARTNFISGRTTCDASNIRCVIRTRSTFVLKGAATVNRQIRHRDIWEHLSKCMKCSMKAGMNIQFQHVQAHNGDWANKRAEQLANETAARLFAGQCDEGYLGEAWCTTCRESYSGAADLATHFKKEHIGRNFYEESLLEALAKSSETGSYECTICHRKLASGFALRQHLTDKHAYW